MSDDYCSGVGCPYCSHEDGTVHTFNFGEATLDIHYEDDGAPVITGFVVCVNDEPYVDTFSEDASITWQLFLPILEADPGLGNEDVRLVKLVED